ncbi:MAG: asparagine synthase-related protein [Solirubrobacteraceae bacterium]
MIAFRSPSGREPGELVVRSEGAAPPRRAQRGSLVALLAGRLDNAQSLLTAPDRGSSDAQVVLEAYLRLGAGCVGKLRGSFAVVIWDGENERLLCVRDPTGTSSLFYADGRDELLLSCAIEGLLSQAGVGRAPNRLAIAEHLCDLWPDRDQTYFSSVRRVPPGCALSVDRSGRRVYRHWDPACATPGEDWLRGDPRELFASRLHQAVERILVDNRAGIFLSGGIDSVSVAAIVSEHSRRQGLASPWALSLAFRHPGVDASIDPDVDEEQQQRAVATTLQMPQLLVDFDRALDGQPLLPVALALSAKMPAPLANFWLPAYRHLGIQGARRGCQVLLTGGGGDEWLAVTPSLAADLIRSGRIAALLELWRNQRRSYPLPLLASLRTVMWTFGARQLVGDSGRAALQAAAPWALRRRWRRHVKRLLPQWIAPEPALRRDLEERAMEVVGAPRAEDHYTGEMRKALDHPLVAMDMEEVFENSREIGVPVRQPYVDADLVELLYRLAPEAHFSGGRDKGLARGMVAERFPELGFGRKRKILATSFSEALFTAEGPRVWESLGSARALAELGVVDAKLLEDELAAGFASPSAGRYAARMWGMLSMEAWLRSRI